MNSLQDGIIVIACPCLLELTWLTTRLSDTDGKWLVSTDGGREPRWSRDGSELFYRRHDQTMVVAVQTKPSFSVGPPKLLFEGRYGDPVGIVTSYDVSPDGNSFLMVQSSSRSTNMHIVLDWAYELEQLVPADYR